MFIQRTINALKLGIFWMIMGVLVFAGIAIAYTVLSKPVYNSSWTMLLPGSGRVSTINLEQIGEAVSNSASAYSNISVSPKTTYREIALSRAVLNRAAERLGLSPAEFGNPKIKLIDQTSAIVFTITGSTARGAQEKARTFNTVFHEALETLRQDELDRQQMGMTVQLERAKQELILARQNILDHQSRSSVVSHEQFEEMALNTERIRLKHADVQSEYFRTTGYSSSLMSAIAITPEQASEILMLQSDQGINAMLARQAELDTEIAAMRMKLASSHPKMQKLQKQADALAAELHTQLETRTRHLNRMDSGQILPLLRQEARSSVEHFIQTLASRKGLDNQASALAEKLKEFENRLSRHSQDAARLADLIRDHQIAEAIFSSALAKIDTGKLDVYATYPLTQLLTEPGLPARPVRLYKLMVIAGAILGSILYITGIFLICLRIEYQRSA